MTDFNSDFKRLVCSIDVLSLVNRSNIRMWGGGVIVQLILAFIVLKKLTGYSKHSHSLIKAVIKRENHISLQICR